MSKIHIGKHIPQGKSHFEEAVYCLTLCKFPENPDTHFIDLRKAESTLDPPSGFEHRCP